MGDKEKILALAMLERLFNHDLIDINTYEKARAELERL